MTKPLSPLTLQSLQSTFGITVTDKKYLRLSDNQELTAILPNQYLGYYHSMIKLKQLGYDINQYCDGNVVKQLPLLFKPLN